MSCEKKPIALSIGSVIILRNVKNPYLAIPNTDATAVAMAEGPPRISYQLMDPLHSGGDSPDSVLFKLKLATKIDNVPPFLVLRVFNPSMPCKMAGELHEEQNTLLRRLLGVESLPKCYEEYAKGIELEGCPADSCVPQLEHAFVREFISGKLLTQWMAEYEALNGSNGPFQGIRELPLWFALAKNIIDALTPIHDERAVHGDLRPRCIMMAHKEELSTNEHASKANIYLLETEEDCPQAYPHEGIAEVGTFRRRYDSPLRLFEKKKADGPFMAIESTAHWFAPTDTFSLGMILFELAYGSDAMLMPFLTEEECRSSQQEADGTRWYKVGSYQIRKSNRQLKNDLLKHWSLRLDKEKWTKAERRDSCEYAIRISEVILACLRSHDDDGVANLEDILEIIAEFQPSVPEISEEGKEVSEKRSAANPPHFKEMLKKGKWGPYLPSRTLESFMRRLGTKYEQERQEMNEKRFLRIRGRSQMVDVLVELLNGLGPDDRCQALLTPAFFINGNMGSYGRLTSALQLAALRQVQIDWIIAVNSEILQDRNVAQLLQQQRAAAQFLRNADADVTYGVYYVVVDQENEKRILRDHLSSICIMKRKLQESDRVDGNVQDPDDVSLLVAPDYHGEFGKLAALRIWPQQSKSNSKGQQGPFTAKTRAIGMQGRRIARTNRKKQLLKSFADESVRKIHISEFLR